MMTIMPFVKWRLEALLAELSISRYELAHAMANERSSEKSRLTQLYRLKDPKNVSLQTLADILSALHDLTGQQFTTNDLLEYTREQAALFESEAQK